MKSLFCISLLLEICIVPVAFAWYEKIDDNQQERIQTEVSNPSETKFLHVITPKNPQDLRELFRYVGEPMHFVGAHRGGSRPGFPENCIESFENTLRYTFAIMEIDPRYTRDDHIVIHHDATLERTTTGHGRVNELTLSQLNELRLKDCDGHVTEFQIPTLDAVLQWARGKTILVLDRKDVPVEARVKKIEEHQAEAFTMLIVYSFKDARRCYDLNRNIMMEVMIPTHEKFYEFDKTGVPWSNVIAFVGHTPPEDPELVRMIHEKGTCCMMGTSRNLDKILLRSDAEQTTSVGRQYMNLLKQGADVIETDLPGEVGNLLYGRSQVPLSKYKLLRKRPISEF